MNVRLRPAFLLALAAVPVLAAPVDEADAVAAARAWARLHPDVCGDAAGALASAEVLSATDGDGATLFHVVRLPGGGTVVTAADDELEPVVAFAGSAAATLDDGNPIWEILRIDMARRLAARDEDAAAAGAIVPQRLSAAKRAAGSAAGGAAAGPAPARTTRAGRAAHAAAWAALLEAGAAFAADPEPTDGPALRTAPAASSGSGLGTVSDIRVAPLLETKWGQGDTAGGRTFNYYTPNHYVCGCVATALAQVMRYHRFPTAAVAPFTNPCEVDGSPVDATSRGGVFDWSSMPAVFGSASTEAQREAAGHLCYDCGVAVQMDWGSSASGAYMHRQASALVGSFGYASARPVFGAAADGNFTEEEEALLIRSNLDAGLPVLVGIKGHAIVADGYGYIGGLLYTHLNLGWEGDYDAWYNLPDVQTFYTSSVFDEAVCNVHPTLGGELVTGRVTDSSGRPLSGVAVSVRAAGDASPCDTGSTGPNGIYALRVPAGGRYAVTASGGGHERTAAFDVAAGRDAAALGGTIEDHGAVGGRAGCDIVLSEAGEAVALRVNGSDTIRSGVPAAYDCEALAADGLAWSVPAAWSLAEPVPEGASVDAAGRLSVPAGAAPRRLLLVASWGGLAATQAVVAAAAGAPAPPAVLKASVGEYTEGVRLSWSASPGAGSYTLYRAATPVGPRTRLQTTTYTNALDASVPAGTNHVYWVKANNAAGRSELSPSAVGLRAADNAAGDRYAEALDAPWVAAEVWDLDHWSLVTTDTHDGEDALLANDDASGGSPIMFRFAVAGPCTVRIWYRLRFARAIALFCRDSDVLRGNLAFEPERDVDTGWTPLEIPVAEGHHHVTFNYVPMEPASGGGFRGFALDSLSVERPAPPTAPPFAIGPEPAVAGDDGAFRVRLDGAAGIVYTLERSEALDPATAAWTDVSVPVVAPADGAPVELVDPFADPPAAFYRVRAEAPAP